ncbi:hypothetical protein [Chryseobacterium limigenitum]|nr:hypothetical protein [Chryseobacterium limigenitum]
MDTGLRNIEIDVYHIQIFPFFHDSTKVLKFDKKAFDEEAVIL